MNWNDVVVIDFETYPIEKRPDYPPRPVGVAIKVGNKKGKYYEIKLNGKNKRNFKLIDKSDVGIVWDGTHYCADYFLREIFDANATTVFRSFCVLMHNSKFDLDVAEHWMGLPVPKWSQTYDTLPMLFLDDPRAKTFALKPSSERLLGLPPNEKDEVVDWLVANQPVPNKRITKKNAGAYIAYAPVDIVGRYAVGDVDRTWRLAKHLYKSIKQRGMLEAYDRERRLMPHLLDMERQGVRVSQRALSRDIKVYEKRLETIDTWLRRKLKVGKDFNLDSNVQLADALIKAKFTTKAKLGVTDTGAIQTNKKAIKNGVEDGKLLGRLTERSKLCNDLRMFLRPWYDTSRRSKGKIFTQWYSTRTDKYGASTGRLASTPNFQNMPPEVRCYIQPYERCHTLLGRDYSQQELRVLAHFEGDILEQAYRKNPWMDIHKRTQKMISNMLGKEFDRKAIKILNFRMLYGSGIAGLSEAIGCTYAEGKALRDAYLHVLPGVRELNEDLKRRAKEGKDVRTWGGRKFTCEESKIIKGELRSFEYKMGNYLIQGSSGDITKESLIRYMDSKPDNHKALLTVHDEILVSVPRKELHEGMKLLKDAMESIELDLPLLSEGEYGKNWGNMKPYDVKGKVVCRVK